MFTPFAFIQPITTAIPITPSAQYLLIGGSFTLYNTPTLSRIAKIDSTGSLDPSFNMGTGFDLNVSEIQQQPDGKYIVGGNFSTYSGSSANRIVRLNQNGTIDTSFAYGTGLNGNLNSISPQSDNSNIGIGPVTSYNGSTTTNGIPINGILKFSPSGAIDTTFNVGFGFCLISILIYYL
jgi:hypothetical protein